MALHELSKGRLSHYLVNSTTLSAGIRDISENLERTSPEFELIYKTPSYYSNMLRWVEQSTKNPTRMFC